MKFIYKASTEESALQALEELRKKWTVKTRDWSKILAQLSIHFDDRLTKYL